MFGLKTQTNKNPFSFSILSSLNLILKHGGGGHNQMPFATKCLPDTFIVASTDILVGNRYKLCKLTSKLFSLKIRSLKFFILLLLLSICHGTHVEDRGQSVGVWSLLLPCAFQGSNSGHQAWHKLLYSLRNPASSKFIKTLNILNPRTGTKTASMHTPGPFFSKGQSFLLPL